MNKEKFKIPTTGFGADGKVGKFNIDEQTLILDDLVALEDDAYFSMSEEEKFPYPLKYCKKCDTGLGRLVTNDMCLSCSNQQNAEDIEDLKKTLNSLSLWMESSKFVHGKTLTPQHEKIERMAWEMLNTLFSIWLSSNCCENFKKFSRGDLMQYAFEVSEAFYDIAKEKEEGVNDESNKT